LTGIIWLASYPKSGNTWLRALLANYEADDGKPADINNFGIWGISSNRREADEALGVECSDLTPEEVDRYRPTVYRNLARDSDRKLFIKTHDAYVTNGEAEPLFPEDITRAVLYVVRNPLDVSISFAHHLVDSIDNTIERMALETTVLARNDDRLHAQLRQRILSWSSHVRSWTEQTANRVHLLRYEDLCLDPLGTFLAAIRFMGLPEDVDRVRRAVAFSSFDVLREQELRHGFREKPRYAPSFFRSGRAGAWREVLSPCQIERVIMDHGEVMKRLGYLSDEGIPQ
jgi:hypothetical protein